MKAFHLSAMLGLGAALLMPAPVIAQTAHCAPRDIVVERLTTKFGEARKSIGLGANNHVVEVFASDESGSWTITVTNPVGLTCLVASGQAFETLAETRPAKGDPA